MLVDVTVDTTGGSVTVLMIVLGGGGGADTVSVFVRVTVLYTGTVCVYAEVIITDEVRVTVSVRGGGALVTVCVRV